MTQLDSESEKVHLEKPVDPVDPSSQTLKADSIPPGTYEMRVESVHETGRSVTVVFGDVKQIADVAFGRQEPLLLNAQDAHVETHSSGEDTNGNARD